MGQTLFVSKKKFWPWIVAIWCVGLAVLIGVYAAVLRPQEQRLHSVRIQVDRIAQQVTALENTRSPVVQERMRRELDVVEDNYAEFQFLPDKLNSLDFRIHALATDCALKNFSSRNLFKDSDKYFDEMKHIAQQKIATSFEANFPAFLRFLNGLERNLPYLYINELQITQNVDHEDDRPSAEIHFVALYEKEAVPEEGQEVASQ